MPYNPKDDEELERLAKLAGIKARKRIVHKYIFRRDFLDQLACKLSYDPHTEKMTRYWKNVTCKKCLRSQKQWQREGY